MMSSDENLVFEPFVSRKEFHFAVSFHNIEYEVGSYCQEYLTVLQGVSGILPRGLNAIMGPTGSGKTSLLDVLAGRKAPRGLSGTVLVNGERQPKNFKCVAGYVVQDDAVMGTLSVRENLHFSAALRLPSSTTRRERKQRVEKVIKELGLQLCADTKIGTELIRGVSGGERKKTNIGMELIIEPVVLFLDEPTTGLDAKTAVAVVEKLKELSKNSIIVMSIHQPRYSIFKLFDTLTLLSQGSMVYHGPSDKALDYFTDLGFSCEEHENPADFFLDVIMLCENHSISDTEGTFDKSESSDTENRVDLETAYLQSNQCKEVEMKLAGIMEDLIAREEGKKAVAPKTVGYRTNVFWQILIILYRSFTGVRRDARALIVSMIQAIVFGLIVGVIYFRLDNQPYNFTTVVNNRIGAISFIVFNQIVSAFPALQLLLEHRPLFIHENITGFYRVSAYFIAMVCFDLVIMRLLPFLFYVIITYFMVGFQQTVSKFFIHLLTLAQTTIAFSSVAIMLGAFAGDVAIAIILFGVVLMFGMLFGGFLVSLESFPVWLRWMEYLTIYHYAVEALCINEIAGLCYYSVPNETRSATSCSEYTKITNLAECEVPQCLNGTVDLTRRGFQSSTAWLWYDQIGLLGLILVHLILTYIGLRAIKKFK